MKPKITQIAQATESTHTKKHLEKNNKAVIKASQTPWQQVEKREGGNEGVARLTLTLRGRRDDRKLGADWTNESGNRILRLTVSINPHTHTHTHSPTHARTHILLPSIRVHVKLWQSVD